MRSSVGNARPSARRTLTPSAASGEPSSVPASGDRLDRMAARLARVLASRPGYDALAPVSIADLYHALLTPHATTADLDLRGADEYDLLLMRLLSGERGYVLADVAVQQALAMALADAGGDRTAYREHAAAMIALAPHALHVLEPARSCRCCNGRLPVGADARFCPHCGEDLGLHRCPACSTVCEVGWRFCISCGRGLDAGA